MESLSIEATGDTPQIILDKGNGIFEISGKSLPERAPDFYRPAMLWLASYQEAPNASTPFVFRLEYYNTATSKVILDILYVLEKIPGAVVKWYFHDDDEDMEESGEEFAELVKVPFELIVY